MITRASFPRTCWKHHFDPPPHRHCVSFFSFFFSVFFNFFLSFFLLFFFFYTSSVLFITAVALLLTITKVSLSSSLHITPLYIDMIHTNTYTVVVHVSRMTRKPAGLLSLTLPALHLTSPSPRSLAHFSSLHVANIFFFFFFLVCVYIYYRLFRSCRILPLRMVRKEKRAACWKQNFSWGMCSVRCANDEEEENKLEGCRRRDDWCKIIGGGKGKVGLLPARDPLYRLRSNEIINFLAIGFTDHNECPNCIQ